MGGHMQPQGHLQLISNTVDYGIDPQAALDAPRWYWARERRVHVERRVPAAVRAALAERGHEVTTARAIDLVGCGQAANSSCVAGTDPRADGCALGY
jgi:gamma-glutamyltranspeptidase/glutathione hydrolase